ncbi:MAG: hypothetical protein A2600_05085 [Candidatus Lambdaproteobacteria bacterium RIFOXYD1_FULL_56_27]|uniref:branched-chain-amino-acid transaminase n=1 Tax=Candidatus Lambdaproteobacteria bacterium RIFOXYD2_FULL_56_26 TaxID=1817773 RepID=A0A1F6GRX8_9PROT|nr:MAG: hypothetical protein A2426_07940 [Candidatus Lambdaproteobacteria bacterium RIFOXYC1_FULL_56_13]OGH00808.1 MAG: hypothetical protein A2557_03800 [Candidatus Lambdaproteobacteria bacterium RIFOXYD2_FULL_56_26]OGH09927.1 MAG: hypothetical protein A2600_05085 [Candidatus Lambdaproteobacteria bacterium RIFOXYD1_FULL_56_27]
MILSFEGKRVEPSQATISVTSEAVTFGRGVFETFLAVEQKVFLLDRHLIRFLGTLQAVGLKVPPERDLRTWLSALLGDAGPGDFRVKLLGLPEGVYLFAFPWREPAPEGWRLFIHQGNRGLAAYKTTSYLEPLLALEAAQAKGGDEALLVNHHGAIYEGSRTNFYWVQNGKVYSKKRAVLPGIIRDFLSQEAPGGLKWGNLSVEELPGIEGAFVTNALRGLVEVIQINSEAVPQSPLSQEWKSWLEQKRFDLAQKP